MWARYIILIILILSSIGLCIWIGLSSNKMRNKNIREEQENIIQFFNMNLPSSEGDSSELVFSCPDWPLKNLDSGGDEQPIPQHNQAVVDDLIGKPPQTFKIEILGAYFDVFDPWGQCSPEPSDIISQACEQDGKNNQGLCSNLVESTEEENGVSTQWYRNIICGTKYQNSSGYGGKVNNKTDNTTEPYGGSDYVCRLQDATPFLSAKCNGRKECRINLGNSNEVSQVFGSVPCYNSTSGVPLNVGDTGYTRLPSDQKGVNNTKFQQGYVVKGIYRCVPE